MIDWSRKPGEALTTLETPCCQAANAASWPAATRVWVTTVTGVAEAAEAGGSGVRVATDAPSLEPDAARRGSLDPSIRCISRIERIACGAIVKMRRVAFHAFLRKQ